MGLVGLGEDGHGLTRHPQHFQILGLPKRIHNDCKAGPGPNFEKRKGERGRLQSTTPYLEM